jgi:hypothetical protein
MTGSMLWSSAARLRPREGDRALTVKADCPASASRLLGVREITGRLTLGGDRRTMPPVMAEAPDASAEVAPEVMAEATRVRCVSIFLDKNRRYIGKSQSEQNGRQKGRNGRNGRRTAGRDRRASAGADRAQCAEPAGDTAAPPLVAVEAVGRAAAGPAVSGDDGADEVLEALGVPERRRAGKQAPSLAMCAVHDNPQPDDSGHWCAAHRRIQGANACY